METEDLIGFFVNTHALRTNLAGNPNFGQLLTQIREVTLAASLRQQPPFHHIVKALGMDRNLAAHSLFQVAFGLQSDFTEGWSLPGLAANRLELDNGTSKFDLTVLLTESSRRLRGRFEYSSDLFDTATVERWARQFRILVEEHHRQNRGGAFPNSRWIRPKSARNGLARGAGPGDGLRARFVRPRNI